MNKLALAAVTLILAWAAAGLEVSTSKAGGFIVTEAERVLAYGEGDFPLPIECPAVQEWLERCEAETALTLTEFQAKTTPEILHPEFPLVKTRWHQGRYYNAFCPPEAGGPDGRAYTGCVATAMGQVMKYWNWPDHGQGTYSYIHSPLGLQYANFDSTWYDWGNMPVYLSGYNDDVARLLYHCGVSVNMNYSATGSGAVTSKAATSMAQFFRYQASAAVNYPVLCWDKSWYRVLMEELDLGRPMIYRGKGIGSHAFICDGYQDSLYFHFNWGWGGSYNGYYLLSDLTPGSYDFSQEQYAIMWIQPQARPKAPENLEIYMRGDSLILAWEPVTEDVFGAEIAVNMYQIFSSSQPYAGYANIGSTGGNRYAAALGEAPRFYRVKAVTD